MNLRAKKIPDTRESTRDNLLNGTIAYREQEFTSLAASAESC
jgi:hypothetical protein